jgi:hypothetical protein
MEVQGNNQMYFESQDQEVLLQMIQHKNHLGYFLALGPEKQKK